uniref:Uncharacterized protein n=1 Tax=Tanacetum cinerariifolium TaxID=118510 RepID=A0A699HMD2_TANCI|nr:hypothetical protein [Tanacetum cinerariifolium]
MNNDVIVNVVEEEKKETAEAELTRRRKGKASPPTIVSKRKKHLLHVVKRMSKQHYYMLKIIRINYLHKNQEKRIYKQVNDALHDVVLEIATAAPNGLVEDNLPWLVDAAVKAEREKFKDEMFSIIVDALQNYMNNNILHVHPMSLSSSAYDLQLDTFCKHNHDDHPDDDAHLERENNAKRQRMFESYEFCRGIFDDAHWVPTTADRKRMVLVLDQMMRNRCETRAKYEYHIQQASNYLNNQIIYESTQEDIIRQFSKKPTLVVQGCARDLKAPAREANSSSSRLCKKSESSCKQAKINLTAPTLTIPGIENLPLHTIITEPFFGLVYENSKEERIIMSIDKIPKFCDATLKKVWKEVKDINVEIRRGYYKPALTKDKKEIMDSFEEEIKVRLKHRDQMRR